MLALKALNGIGLKDYLNNDEKENNNMLYISLNADVAQG